MTAVGHRKRGRPAAGSVRVEFRASAETGRWLASRMGRMPRAQIVSKNTQAATEIGLWRAVLAAELARIRLSLPQAIAVAEVLNSPDIEPAVSTGIGMVFAQCHDAFRLARSGPAGDCSSYGRKHGFDESVLLDYLGSLGPAADHALADAISRWWQDVQPRDGGQWRDPDDGFRADSAEGFAAAGLRVTEQ